MDGAHGGQPAAGAGAGAFYAGGDWRALLQPEVRSRIVRKIMETLKKHLPLSTPEGLTELQKIAVRFEEKIYTAATSQSDYLRKISLKMLAMESQREANIQDNHQNGQVIQNQSPLYQASSSSTSHTGYPDARDVKEELYEMSDYLRKISLKMLSMESQREANIQDNHQNGQVIQNQSPLYQASSSSTSHTGYPDARDVKEELYEMNKTLKDQYLAGLGDLHEISMKLDRDNHVSPQKPANLHEEADFKGTLERSLHSLQINKNCVQLCLEENTPMYKKQITGILNSKEWTLEEKLHRSAVQDSGTSSTCEKNLDLSER